MADSSDSPIRRRDHPLVKSLKKLKRRPRAEGKMVVEGSNLVAEALASPLAVELVIHTNDWLTDAPNSLAQEIARPVRIGRVVRVSNSVFDTVSSQVSPQGILAVCARPEEKWSLLETRPREPAVFAHQVQDPGNLGAIARAAEAVSARALISSEGCDPLGEKALRGSMGSLLRLPVLTVSEPLKALRQLEELGYQTLAASMNDEAIDFRDADWSLPPVLIVGNESAGLDPGLERAVQQRIRIPMAGEVQSLNVAMAATLLLYEWHRNQ